jgi:hypothetical protein
MEDNSKSQSFNYYHFGNNTKDRLIKSKFEQLPILDRLVHDDFVKGMVHSPKYLADGTNSYYLVMRGDTLTRISVNNPTNRRIPYASLEDDVFKEKYRLSKNQHQQGYWVWQDKIESKDFCTFVL